MYGLAYVMLPPHYTNLQTELDRALAPFQRGGEETFPREKLAFDDETDALIDLHRSRVVADARGSVRWLDGSPECAYYLDVIRLRQHLEACQLDSFDGVLSELEPSFDAFVTSFTRSRTQDPATGRYGRWLNPLGKWDWWELGGRFNGWITGERRPASAHQLISSGDNAGRRLMDNLADALGADTNTAKAEVELNVELVSTLRQRREEDPPPVAIVLPHGSGPDAARWFDSIPWRQITPETRAMLAAPQDCSYRSLVGIAYDRFHDHVAAGVAFHF